MYSPSPEEFGQESPGRSFTSPKPMYPDNFYMGKFLCVVRFLKSFKISYEKVCKRAINWPKTSWRGCHKKQKAAVLPAINSQILICEINVLTGQFMCFVALQVLQKNIWLTSSVKWCLNDITLCHIGGILTFFEAYISKVPFHGIVAEEVIFQSIWQLWRGNGNSSCSIKAIGAMGF